MRHRWSEITLALAFSTFACLATAGTEAPKPSHSGQREVTVSVRANMTAEKSSTLRVTLHTDEALKSFGIQRFSLRNGIDSLDIIEAYDGHLAGDRAATVAKSAQSSDGGHIICGDYGSGTVLANEQVEHRSLAAGDAIVAVADEFFTHGQSVFAHRGNECIEAKARSGEALKASDEADFSVAE